MSFASAWPNGLSRTMTKQFFSGASPGTSPSFAQVFSKSASMPQKGTAKTLEK